MGSDLGTDLIGQTLEGYTITGRLGAGGRGEVYAHDSRLGRDVAISDSRGSWPTMRTA